MTLPYDKPDAAYVKVVRDSLGISLQEAQQKVFDDWKECCLDTLKQRADRGYPEGTISDVVVDLITLMEAKP